MGRQCVGKPSRNHEYRRRGRAIESHPTIEITKVRNRITGTRITVKALKGSVVRAHDGASNLELVLDAGDTLSLHVRTSYWVVGERITPQQLVNAARNKASLPWKRVA